MTKKNIFNLNNKVSVITGGAGLLGPEHAIALSNFGSEIFLLDIDDRKLKLAKEKIVSYNKSALVHTTKLDITIEDELKNFLKKIKKSKKNIDILVNNAAIDPKMDNLNEMGGSIENYKLETLQNEINVGLIGTFLCCKVFGTEMAKKGKGSIINIASDLAILAPDQRVYSSKNTMETVLNYKPIGYPIIKSGMLGLNRYLATYWAHKNVRVNCLVPGAVKNKQSKKLVKQIETRIPLSRLAKKSDYHGALVFLASSASDYMTGQLLIVDGGRSIW